MKLGVPSVVVVTESFEGLAKAIAASRGVPDFPLVVLPSSVEEMSADELEGLGEAALDKIIHAVTGADGDRDVDGTS